VILAVVAFMAPSAAQVATDIQAHYAKQPQLTLEFEQVVTHGTTGMVQRSQGTLALARPGSFRASYVKIIAKAPKPSRDFIYDGKKLWLVDYPNLEIHESTVPAAQLPTAAAFLLGGDLSKTYDLALSGSTLVLTPKQPSAEVKELDLVVDPKTGDVIESIIKAPNDDVSEFHFAHPNTATLPADTFAHDRKKYPNFKLTVHP